MSTPETVESILAAKLKVVLTDWCIARVADDDRSVANHVIVGKPTSELRDPIVVSIYTEHPLGPVADKDKIVMGPPRGDSERPYKFPPETNGGMRTKQIIGAVQVNVREDLSAEDATVIKTAVMARVEKAINTDKRLGYFEDDFGNHMIDLDTFKASGYASGGGNVSIYIGWQDWRAFVSSTNCRS